MDPFRCVVLNYRACLLFNRSAEELMPQPRSQPSCIIAPVCHCQRLGKATSDCFLPLSPLFAFYLPHPTFPLSPTVFILIRLTSFSSRPCRGRQSKSEHIEYIGGNRRGLIKRVQRFYLNVGDEPQMGFMAA